MTDDDIPALTMTIDPTSVSEAAGTAAAIGTVLRNDADLSAAVTVTLSSSDEDEATVPSSITIPINYASVTFFIDAVDDTIVDGTQTVTISAGATDYVDGSGILTVTDDEVFTPTLTVTIDPTSVSEAIGTAAATGTVWRNDLDLSTPVTVTLTSSDEGEATIPTSVTIAANEASATFPIDTVDDGSSTVRRR